MGVLQLIKVNQTLKTIATSQVVVNEKKQDLSMLIDKNFYSVITMSFLRGIDKCI